MRGILYSSIKRILYESFKCIAFKIDPERIHHLAINLCGAFPRQLSFLFGNREEHGQNTR